MTESIPTTSSTRSPRPLKSGSPAMHVSSRKLILGGLSLLLIAALIGFVMTREGAAPVLSKPAGRAAPAAAKLVDRSPLETARGLSSVASTSAEQQLAADVARIADHEVDLAFVT